MYVAENGTRYEGTYINGFREGFGTLYNGDGNVSYKGNVSRGLPHGTGSIFRNGKEKKANWVHGIDAKLLPKDDY